MSEKCQVTIIQVIINDRFLTYISQTKNIFDAGEWEDANIN